MDEDVARFELLKNGLVRVHLRGVARLVGREAKLRVIDQVNQLGEARQIHRALHAVQRQRGQFKLLEQKA